MIANLQPYPMMKNSGVPWLGVVPEHWTIERLRSWMSNVVQQTAERQNGDLYIALEHVESWTGRLRQADSDVWPDSQVKRFRSGDVLFGKLRPYLAKVTRPTRDGVCVGEFFVLRPRNSNATAAFMEQLLRSKPVVDAINSSTFGAKMPRADWQFVGGMTVTLPPLPEQASIVRFLINADRRIRRYVRAKQKLIKLLEEQKQATIHRAVRTGLEPHVRLKPSGVNWLGDVPEHWEVRRIASFSPKITNGWVGPTRDILRDSGVPYVQSLHIKHGTIRFARKFFVSDDWLGAHPKIRLRLGDVVIVQTGDIGQVACVPANFDGAGCHALIIIGTNERVMAGQFLDLVLRSRYGFDSLKSLQTGALHPHLNCTWVREIVIPVPPVSEQRKILQWVGQATSPLDQTIASSQRELDLLREYHTRLIADVVTGKLDVRAAAARVSDETEEPGTLDEPDDLTDAEEILDDDVEPVAEEAEA